MSADPLSNDLASLRIDRSEPPVGFFASRRGRFALVLAAFLLVIATAVVWRAFSARVFQTAVEVTEIRLVSPAQASVQVTSTGYVVATSRSKVGAKVLGRVAEVRVSEGDTVTAGQVLVRLEDAESQMATAASRARLSAARARLQAADADHAETRRQYERERDLAAQGAGLRSTVEDLEARVASLAETTNAARAEAAAALAEHRQRELSHDYLTVSAPIDGVVISEPVDVGELVGPTTPEPVVEIADFTTLVIETDVPEARLGLIQREGPAEIVLDAYPTVRHRGRVAEISPRVNRAKATVVVKVAFVDETEGVLPDMAARVSFLERELEADAMREPPKLFVPASAVVERGGEKVVFRIDDGKARLEPVRLGPPMAGGYELAQGPGDGTRVIANAPQAIADGYPIKEKL